MPISRSSKASRCTSLTRRGSYGIAREHVVVHDEAAADVADDRIDDAKARAIVAAQGAFIAFVHAQAQLAVAASGGALDGPRKHLLPVAWPWSSGRR